MYLRSFRRIMASYVPVVCLSKQNRYLAVNDTANLIRILPVFPLMSLSVPGSNLNITLYLFLEGLGVKL